MKNLINLKDREKPSNCVSYHDDICFADNYDDEESNS